MTDLQGVSRSISRYSFILKVLLCAGAIVFALMFAHRRATSSLPLVAIANYGPHASLEAGIQGVKEALAAEGFIENRTLRYVISDPGFDISLIPQVISQLSQEKPAVMVVMGTPIAQFVKRSLTDIPLVFNAVTDPQTAGLLVHPDHPDGNMTGSSDRQNLAVMLQFAKQLLPQAKTVGLLYSSGEANDEALVRMLQHAATQTGLRLIAIPVDQLQDVPVRLQGFKGKVDFLYVGVSGKVQPALPVIAAECMKMRIPVLNADEEAVRQGLVLASFGVDYHAVGEGAGRLVAALLRGTPVSDLTGLSWHKKSSWRFESQECRNTWHSGASLSWNR